MRDDFDDDYGGSGASDVILSFLIGGLTGAALALLYAPRTGQETRDLLGERLRETADRGREMKQEVVGRGRAVVRRHAQFHPAAVRAHFVGAGSAPTRAAEIVARHAGSSIVSGLLSAA